MRERLSGMGGAMTHRRCHQVVSEVRGRLAFGASGPGLLSGNYEAHPGVSDAVLYAEGEVYDIQDIRRRYECDSEWSAVCRHWQEKGPEGLKGIDGLYNLLLWKPDRDGGTLSILNDRYGSRRLYICERNDCIVFASELKAILAWPELRPSIDESFVKESVCLANPLGEKTWFREVYLLPPATLVTITRNGLKKRRYWSWEELPPEGSNCAPDRLEHLHELWCRSVRIRLANESCGQQLSGGLDSRLILGEATKHRALWIACTYGEPKSDEVEIAQLCVNQAQCAWTWWPLPGDNWLESRVQLMLETDGMLDLANAHHAGLVEVIGKLLRFELSGFLGDLVLGDTWYDVTSPDEALNAFAHWSSPVSLSREEARDRLAARLSSRYPVVWSLVDEKCRRMTNAWAHLASNYLEVRKPFVDYKFLEFCAGLPVEDRRGSRIYIQLLKQHYPHLARIKWQKNGAPPGASAIRRLGVRGVRYLRQKVARVVPAVRTQGIRGAANVYAWLSEPAVQSEIRSRLQSSNAVVSSLFDKDAIKRTLVETIDKGGLAVEVVLGLYRVERYLQHVANLTRGRNHVEPPSPHV
jgi:asparagine synthetase B (glutamine-hydrolysing)